MGLLCMDQIRSLNYVLLNLFVHTLETKETRSRYNVLLIIVNCDHKRAFILVILYSFRMCGPTI